MIISRLTTQSRTWLQRAVRVVLRVSVGDQLASMVDAGVVTPTKAPARRTDAPFATFAEWAGEADRKAFADP